MQKRKITKAVAVTLTTAMLVQPLEQTTFAAEAITTTTNVITQYSVDTQLELQDGIGIIPEGADESLVKEILGKALIKNADEVDLQSIEWEYSCEGTGKLGALTTNTAWGSINGFTSEKKIGFSKVTFTHKALSDNSDGIYSVRIAGTTTEVKFEKAAKLQTSIILKDNVSVALTYNEDLSVDYDRLLEEIFENTVDTDNTIPEGLTLSDITIEYYATAKTGAVGNLGRAWVPVEGGKVNGLEYPGLPEGEQRIRITYAGNEEYFKAQAETTLTVKGREESSFNVAEAPYKVDFKFSDATNYDYDATARAIYDAVIESVTPETVNYEDVVIKYNAGTDIIKNWQPLNTTDWTSTFTKFGPGNWTIQISWAGNREYKGTSVEVNVELNDNRLNSAVLCKENVTFTYNMDADVVKQQIFDNVIDWENSTLPDKDTLTIDDFTMEYYGENTVGGISGGVKQWAPIEGGTVNLLTYENLSAGEQKIRLTYKGNAQYRASQATEAAVTVAKAKVKVKVNSKTLYADETVTDMVTTNPADRFDIYTVYTGVSSNVNLGVYLELPEKYTSTAVLKLLDPVMEKIYGKTFSQMMQDGVTVGELREIFNTQELLDILDKLNIDTGILGQIMTIINKMPSVADGIRVGFGTPNRAGVYNVTTITDSKNYNTGFGVGILRLKMRTKGVKLNWNEQIQGKMTESEALEFDFGATVSYEGNTDIVQDNVRYLYSGFTSKGKIYSSTTTAPTQAGRYVVTVVTVGGNYQAAPITRTFQITK